MSLLGGRQVITRSREERNFKSQGPLEITHGLRVGPSEKSHRHQLKGIPPTRNMFHRLREDSEKKEREAAGVQQGLCLSGPMPFSLG